MNKFEPGDLVKVKPDSRVFSWYRNQTFRVLGTYPHDKFLVRCENVREHAMFKYPNFFFWEIELREG